MKITQFMKNGINYFYAFTLFLGLLMTNVMTAQNGTAITGLITDSSGMPLSGVNIIEKGTKNSTSTNFDGKFSLDVNSSSAVLIASYIGFETQEITLAGRTNVTVKLKSDSESLKEVVVVGYGSVKKSNVTGSVSTVSNAAITQRNVSNPLEAIQGSMAGVQITSATGRVGDGYNVVIRGNNSLNGSAPLYVVDGVPTDGIQFLNPQDIARMDVLKDAASAAIYGSRGASGVIIVTTKSGSSVKSGVHVDFETSYGLSNVTRLPQMMTGQEWWAFHQAAYLNATPTTQTPANLASLAGNQSPLLVSRAASGYNFDWYDAVLKTGMTQNNYLNLTGRSNSGLGYTLSFGAQTNEGNIENDKQNKYSFKLGVNHKINEKFSTGANITVNRTENQLGSNTAMTNAFRYSPLMSPYAVDVNGNEIPGQLYGLPGKLYYPDGVTWAINKTSTNNPLLEIENSSQEDNSWTTIGNVYFQYQILPWMSFKTSFAAGIDNTQLKNSYGKQTDTGIALTNKNSANTTNYYNFNYTWDNQIDFKHTFAEKHAFSAMLLQSFYSNVVEQSYLYANGQPFDTGTNNIGSGVQTSYNVSSSYAKNTLNSYAVRLNYEYDNKYLITASTRWDGSSVLAEGEKWASFPSIALGWKINKESFLENSNTISNLKLRASLGYTGNDNVDPYTTQALLDQQTFYANGANLVTGWQSANLANQALTWEKTREVDFGLDFGFLNNRISGTVDVYDRLSDNLIYKQQLPTESGWSNTYSNVGSVSNKGIEATLVTQNIKTNKVNWETTFTFTKNVNELVSIYDQDQQSDVGNNLILGEPLMTRPPGTSSTGTFVSNYNYVYDGVWQESEAATAASYGQAPGQAKPKDLDGDGKFTANDRTVNGNPNPEWQGSFYSNLTVGQFDFNFSVLASEGQTVLSTFHQNFGDTTDRGRQKMAMDYFVPTNSAGLPANANNDNPRPGPAATGAGAYWGSGFAFYRDVSYVKIKNITVGYTLESDLLKKLKMSNFRIYVNVLNPFVFTDYEGYDPEWAAAGLGVNQVASITTQLGLSVKF